MSLKWHTKIWSRLPKSRRMFLQTLVFMGASASAQDPSSMPCMDNLIPPAAVDEALMKRLGSLGVEGAADIIALPPPEPDCSPPIERDIGGSRWLVSACSQVDRYSFLRFDPGTGNASEASFSVVLVNDQCSIGQSAVRDADAERFLSALQRLTRGELESLISDARRRR